MANGGFIWHEGDYLRDTSHLTDMEDLAYRRLLGAYHSRGGPLPICHEKLCRIARMESKHVVTVIEEFFAVGEDGLLHQRGADRRIKEREAFISEQTRKAKLGAKARWENARGHKSDALGQCSGITGAMPGSCPPSPSPSPSPIKDPPTPRKGEAMTEEFLTFYAAYPKHEGKADAWKAWKSLKRKLPALTVILAAVENQKRGRKWKEGYIKAPASWLRAGSWEDEVETQAERNENAFVC